MRWGEVSDELLALSYFGLSLPSVIAIRRWGDFEGWEHKLVLDEARRRFALGARLGSTFLLATPPMENREVEQLPGRYQELLEI